MTKVSLSKIVAIFFRNNLKFIETGNIKDNLSYDEARLTGPRSVRVPDQRWDLGVVMNLRLKRWIAVLAMVSTMGLSACSSNRTTSEDWKNEVNDDSRIPNWIFSAKGWHTQGENGQFIQAMYRLPPTSPPRDASTRSTSQVPGHGPRGSEDGKHLHH